jgi:MtrB/PioB family decaheme-associated outer membrane protein
MANSMVIGGAPSATTAGSAATPVPTQAKTFSTGLAYFAQPVDYDMDRYDLTAAYGNERLQAQVGYTLSEFTDNSSVFTAQNPFAFPTGTYNTPAASLTGIYTLPPSNMSNQVRAVVGYNFGPTTRLTGNIQYGINVQNASYTLGSGDPAATAAETEPRNSLDGKAETIDGNIALTTQPLDHLDVRLAYSINDYNNRTSSNDYEVNARDNNANVNGDGDCVLIQRCINLPFSFDHQTFTAEAGYRILPQTKLMLTETYETMNRTYADASLVTTNTVTAKVRSSIMDDLFGSLSYSHQNRVAHNYTDNATLNDLGSNSPASPTNVADPAGFMLFFEASRVHDDVKGELDLSSFETLSASVFGKFSKDVYPDGSYGLRNNHNLSIGPDVSWQVTPDLNAHAYYTYQQIYYDQSSLYSASPASGVSIPVNWTANTRDSEQTVGITLDWQAIKDVLKFGLDYNFSYGDTAYGLGDGVVTYLGTVTSPTYQSIVTMQQMPDVTSTLNSISLHGEYDFRPNMALLFGYSFQQFNYKDAMYSSANTQYANALLPGTLVPNAAIHTVGASLRVHF